MLCLDNIWPLFLKKYVSKIAKKHPEIFSGPIYNLVPGIFLIWWFWFLKKAQSSSWKSTTLGEVSADMNSDRVSTFGFCKSGIGARIQIWAELRFLHRDNERSYRARPLKKTRNVASFFKTRLNLFKLVALKWKDWSQAVLNWWPEIFSFQDGSSKLNFSWT